MSYDGYLLKIGGTPAQQGNDGTVIPFSIIKLESYVCTPNQRMELYAYRDTAGGLHRATVSNVATKIEFNTKYLHCADQITFMNTIRGAWSSALERKVYVRYYDQETGAYRFGYFYMPDIKWTVWTANATDLVYTPTRIAFIEYDEALTH